MIDLERKRIRQREWKANRRNKAIADLGGKCVDCGGTDLLQFDHVIPTTKLHEMTNIWSRSLSVRVNELKKCVLRCEDCHKIKSKKDRAVVAGLTKQEVS